ncbi:MAG: Fic family protein [Ilumatobacter sp.]
MAGQDFMAAVRAESGDLIGGLRAIGVPFKESISGIGGSEEAFTFSLSFDDKHEETVRAKLQLLFDQFYEDVEESPNKLVPIARLHKQLEYLHPFKDANTRTNLVVLNRLLVEFGFSPVILDDPNQSYVQSLQEWQHMLIKGMVRWQAVEASAAEDTVRRLRDFDAENGTPDRLSHK